MLWLLISSPALRWRGVNSRVGGMWKKKKKEHRSRLYLSSLVLETCRRVRGMNSCSWLYADDCTDWSSKNVCFIWLSIFQMLETWCSSYMTRSWGGKTIHPLSGCCDVLQKNIYSGFHNCQHNVLHHLALSLPCMFSSPNESKNALAKIHASGADNIKTDSYNI